MIRTSLLRGLAMAQGLGYLGTGVWPLVSMDSFEKVTGPKTDDWLVKTVGTMIAVSGTSLSVAGLRGRITPEMFLLGAGSAAALGAIDLIYVAKGAIRPIYLADAVVEAGIVGAWLFWYPFNRPRRPW